MYELHPAPARALRLATFAVVIVSGKHQFKAHSVCAL
jgi:hypothetical protein